MRPFCGLWYELCRSSGRRWIYFALFGPPFLCALSSMLGHEAYVFGRPSDYSSWVGLAKARWPRCQNRRHRRPQGWIREARSASQRSRLPRLAVGAAAQLRRRALARRPCCAWHNRDLAGRRGPQRSSERPSSSVGPLQTTPPTTSARNAWCSETRGWKRRGGSRKRCPSPSSAGRAPGARAGNSPRSSRTRRRATSPSASRGPDLYRGRRRA